MDKKVVRSSYESFLDATARLAAYATSKPFSEAFEVNERQDILAADDLVVFCVHARRLVENVGLRKLLSQTNVKVSDGSSIALWKVIGCLIHHDLLMIFRCEARFRMLQASLAGVAGDEFFKKIEAEIKTPAYSVPISPQVLFKSDRIHYTMINLAQFLQIFSQDIIPALIKKALDEGLCLLDDPLKDFNEAEKQRALSNLKARN